jgi:hypothetical protein
VVSFLCSFHSVKGVMEGEVRLSLNAEAEKSENGGVVVGPICHHHITTQTLPSQV